MELCFANCLRWIFLSLCLVGCNTVPTQFPAYWKMTRDGNNCIVDAGFERGCGAGTPEKWTKKGDDQPKFRLHFIEFDDQGWLLPPETDEVSQVLPHAPSRTQIDAALEDISNTLAKGRKVHLMIFVHGWKHSANPQDRDVIRFRELVSDFQTTQQALSLSPAVARAPEGRTEFIGIYVGWRGRSWATNNYFTNVFLNTTFWTRKATAIRVAQGQVRELFARVRGLQEYWNDEKNSPRCNSVDELPDCKLRTFMMGHSFGAWILYAAVSQSIVEVLSMDKDLPEKADTPSQQVGEVVKPSQRRRARLADLILLVNPAFEGVRYATVHEAARRQKPPDTTDYEPPLLISITSTGDMATGTFFPFGRSINGALEHWTDTPQKEAMLHTPGHMLAFQTHRLDTIDMLAAEGTKGLPASPECTNWAEMGETGAPDNFGRRYVTKPEYRNDPEKLEKQSFANAGAESAARASYFSAQNQSTGWKPRPPRRFCGDLVLMPTPNSANLPVYSPIWNITTSPAVIPDHSNFMTPEFFNFVKQIYGDRLQPRTKTIVPVQKP